MRAVESFSTCPACGKTWNNRADFLADPTLILLGYQANFRFLELGYILFTHKTCGTTLSVRVHQFRDLYDGPVFKDRKTHSTDCLGLCLQRTCLDECPAQCECAYVRVILALLRKLMGAAPGA